MSDLRTAAKEALEALNSIDVGYRSPSGNPLELSFDEGKCEAAITALRAALAQQEEPVAWLQPKTVDGYSRPDLGYETCSRGDYGAFPVHTSPPRRTMVPLTVKEIFDAFYAVKNATPISKRHGLSVLEIARLVEKASWEKNNGQA